MFSDLNVHSSDTFPFLKGGESKFWLPAPEEGGGGESEKLKKGGGSMVQGG